MDDIFIIKPPSAPTIQQKKIQCDQLKRLSQKSVEQVNLKHRQLNGEIVDNEPLFVRNLPLLSHHLQNH